MNLKIEVTEVSQIFKEPNERNSALIGVDYVFFNIKEKHRKTRRFVLSAAFEQLFHVLETKHYLN